MLSEADEIISIKRISILRDAIRDFEYAKERKPERFYISKRFKHPQKDNYWRFGHRIFRSEYMPEIVKEKDEFILHKTDTGIQQIKAKFLEDSRKISHLWIQRSSTKTNTPMGDEVVIYGEKIGKLMQFLESIRNIEIPTDSTFNVDFDDLRLVHLPDADARKILEYHPDLVAEFARNKVTTEDIRSTSLSTTRTWYISRHAASIRCFGE